LRLGQDTREVLAERLGWSEDALNKVAG